jgi:hypothetical protein
MPISNILWWSQETGQPRRNRLNYSYEYEKYEYEKTIHGTLQAQVVLGILKEEKTLAKISSEYGLEIRKCCLDTWGHYGASPQFLP